MLLGELSREFPRKKGAADEGLEELDRTGAQLSAFLAAEPPMPSSGFWEGRTLARKAGDFQPVPRGYGIPKALREDETLGPVLTSPLDVASMSEGSASHASGVHIMRSILSPGWTVSASSTKLRLLLKKRMRELGVILLSGVRPSLIHSNGSKVVGLSIEDSSHTYNCTGLIVAAPLTSIAAVMPEGRRKRKLEMAAEQLEPRLCTMTLNMIVPARAVPDGMGRVVMLASGGEEGERHPIMLNLLPVVRNKIVQKDEALVSATMVLQRSKLRKDRAVALASLKAELLERMARPFPFIVEKTALISTPYDAERMTDLSGAAFSLDQYEPPELARGGKLTLGLCALPARMCWDNMFMASRQVFPGMGIEGEFFCGGTIAELVKRMNPKAA